MTFNAFAGVPYRLWLRGKADRNYWGNDSVFAQFDGTVDANGTAQLRIGTTGAAEVNLEDCSGCGLSNWGWQDTGWGTGVMGPLLRFYAAASSGCGSRLARTAWRSIRSCCRRAAISPARQGR